MKANKLKDIDEKEWLSAITSNPAFDFLKNKKEDIYSITDGKPVNDEVADGTFKTK